MTMELLQSLQTTLQQMRLNEEMCDLHIVSKEGTRHPVHSLILAATSPVFKAMVTRDFKELKSKEIQFPDVEDCMLKSILDFIYTGELQMTNENTLDLFVIADRLELLGLFFSCVKYIKDHVDITNCLGMQRIADRYSQKELLEYALLYLLRNFQEFAETEDFLDLTVDEFTTILLRDELNVDKEELLFVYVLRWVDHDESRGKELEKLMKCLRYPLMSYDFIEGEFRNHPRFSGEKESVQKLVQSIYKGCFQITERITNDPNPDLNCLKLRHRVPSQVIFLYGGWNRGHTLDKAECYNTKTGYWYPADHTKDETEGRSYFGIEYINGEVYIIGGYSGRAYLNTLRVFNPNTRMWSSITPMHYRRCFASSVTLGNDLYVIAGFDGSRRLTSVEKYSTITKEWTVMKPLVTPRSDAAAVVHNGRIYILGGYAGDSLNTCEVYDAKTDTWTSIRNMNSQRSGASAISIPEENKILVLGGYNGSTRVASIEYYDPETNTWSYGPPMSQERSNFATCVINNKLYVIGGFTGSSTLRDVEIYDFRTRTWQFGRPINGGRSAMKAVCLENVSNAEQFFQMDSVMSQSHENEFYEQTAMEGGFPRRRQIQ